MLDGQLEQVVGIQIRLEGVGRRRQRRCPPRLHRTLEEREQKVLQQVLRSTGVVLGGGHKPPTRQAAKQVGHEGNMREETRAAMA